MNRSADTKPSLAGTLQAWRRSEALTQAQIAERLGVSQQAISCWERGIDVPGPRRLGLIRSLIEQANDIAVEKACIRDQSSIRALMDPDGVRILQCSAGFVNLWPDFSQMAGLPLEERLVGEAAELHHQAETRRDILAGDIAMVSGVSLRHFDIALDEPLKHRWFIRFRRYGARVLGDMILEPCAADASVGIERLLRPDEMAA